MSHTKTERDAAIKHLQEVIVAKNIRTIWLICRHTARSGMVRHIEALTLTSDPNSGEIDVRTWGYYVSRALGWGHSMKYGNCVVVRGCGMDMGAHLVMELSRVIYRDIPRDQWPKDLPLRNGEVETQPDYVLKYRGL